MAETPLTASQADALSGATDGDLDFAYPTIGESPYYTTAFRCWEKVVRVLKAVNALRAYKDGALTFGVRAGTYMDGGDVREYAGAAGQALTNNAVNYVWLTAAGTLAVGTSGFPAPSATPHVPLATIETAGGDYAHADITDCRGRAIFGCVSALTAADMNVLHAWADPDGLARADLAAEPAAGCPVPLTLCRNADGTVLDGSGGAGKFLIHSFGWGAGHLKLEGQGAQGDTKTDTLCFEFALPPEYVAGGDVELVVHARRAGAGAAGTCTIDAEVYELDAEGAAGFVRASDAEALTGDWADHAFDDITATNLAPGDRLMVFVRTSVEETGGEDVLAAEIGRIEVRLDIKG